MNITALKRIYTATNGNTTSVKITNKEASHNYNSLFTDGYIESNNGYIDFDRVYITHKGIEALSNIYGYPL